MNVESIAHGAEHISPVTAATFDALVLGGSGPIVVEFMSYGCAHCRALEPVLQHVAELESQEHFFRCNVAIEPELVRAYAIEGTPTLVMFRDGREIGRAVGPHPSLTSLRGAVTRPFAP